MLHTLGKIIAQFWREYKEIVIWFIIVLLISLWIFINRHKIFDCGPVIGAKEENNSWDWVAFTLASISCLVAGAMAIWQFRTERNTVKITLKGQVELLSDYVRHFYANLVITEAIKTKHENAGLMTCYPSEEHFLKLQADTDPLHPEIFYRNIEKYNSIHNLLVILRNYNLETEVACKHICDRVVPTEAKERDYKTLEFKPNLIAKRVYDCIANIQDDKMVERKTLQKIEESLISAAIRRQELDQEKDDAIVGARADFFKKALADKHIELPENTTESKDIIAFGKSVLKPAQVQQIDLATIKSLDVPQYIQRNPDPNKEHNIAKLYFSDKSLFYTLVNANIWHEIHGQNTSSGAKIFLIPFGE